MKPNSPNSSYKLPAMIIIVVIIALGGGYAVYNNKKPADKTTSTSGTAAKSNKLVIKDFGIVLTLPKDLVGTRAETADRPASTPSYAPHIVNLILPKYSYTVTGCLGNKYDFSTPFASISKINGTAPAEDKQLLKQFSGFYVERVGSALKLTCKDSSTQTVIDGLNTQYDKDLKETFSTAQLTK